MTNFPLELLKIYMIEDITKKYDSKINTIEDIYEKYDHKRTKK